MDVKLINKVFHYLGAEDISQISEWGEPLNSIDRYNLILNIAEVEKFLGNSENGCLFR